MSARRNAGSATPDADTSESTVRKQRRIQAEQDARDSSKAKNKGDEKKPRCRRARGAIPTSCRRST